MYVYATVLSRLSQVRPFVILWTIANQVPLSIEFSRQGYWSGLPFPSLGNLPNPGVKPRSPVLQADSLPSEPPGKLLKVYRWDQGYGEGLMGPLEKSTQHSTQHTVGQPQAAWSLV